MFLKLLVKPLLHSVFSTDHLNHKTVNKTTCRMPLANPHQLYAHSVVDPVEKSPG